MSEAQEHFETLKNRLAKDRKQTDVFNAPGMTDWETPTPLEALYQGQDRDLPGGVILQLEEAALPGVYSDLDATLKGLDLGEQIVCKMHSSFNMRYEFGSSHGYLASIFVPYGPRGHRMCYAELALVQGIEGGFVAAKPPVPDREIITRVENIEELVCLILKLRSEDKAFGEAAKK